jgi:hypothetical protein
MRCILCKIIFLESFSQVLIFDMHFYMHSYLHKNSYSCKKVGVTGTQKQKIMSWTKITTYLELIFARGLALIHLVNLSIATSRWVKPPGTFLKGPKRSRPHMANGHVTEIVWSSWAGAWIFLTKYWHPCKTS